MSKTTNKFAPEVRERAIRMVLDHERDYAKLQWVEWFNNRRLLEPIGNIPPTEAEQRYYAMLDETPMAA